MVVGRSGRVTGLTCATLDSGGKRSVRVVSVSNISMLTSCFLVMGNGDSDRIGTLISGIRRRLRGTKCSLMRERKGTSKE